MITFPPTSLGERIKKIRMHLGCNMEEFGQKLDPPVAKGTISKWENDKYSPNIERIHQIADLVDIQPQYLLTGDPFYNLSTEEQEEWIEHQIQEQERAGYILSFKEKKYVQLEDFINPIFPRHFYINGHKLEKDEIEMLIKLFEGKEKNYPSDKDIEDEYNSLREDYLKYLSKKANKEQLLYFGEATQYKFHK